MSSPKKKSFVRSRLRGGKKKPLGSGREYDIRHCLRPASLGEPDFAAWEKKLVRPPKKPLSVALPRKKKEIKSQIPAASKRKGKTRGNLNAHPEFVRTPVKREKKKARHAGPPPPQKKKKKGDQPPDADTGERRSRKSEPSYLQNKRGCIRGGMTKLPIGLDISLGEVRAAI